LSSRCRDRFGPYLPALECGRAIMLTSHVFQPSRALRDFVSHFLYLGARGGGGQVRPIIARTDVVLAFNVQSEAHRAFEYRTAAPRVLPRAVLVGPQTARRADLLLGDCWASFGIHFQPAAFSRLFHVPVAEFTDMAVDAVDVLGPRVQQLHDLLCERSAPAAMMRVTERFLLRQVANAAPRHCIAQAAAALIETNGRMRVTEAIRASGISERHFERRFREHLGMGPKLYARVARLNFVLRLQREQPSLTWAEISQEAGYFDQTHLVKDFRAMAGATPARFVRAGARTDGGFLLSSAPRHA
jgi:methylphosphotriester-DNA--protein-cysteine methyltransferase